MLIKIFPFFLQFYLSDWEWHLLELEACDLVTGWELTSSQKHAYVQGNGNMYMREQIKFGLILGSSYKWVVGSKI